MSPLTIAAVAAACHNQLQATRAAADLHHAIAVKARGNTAAARARALDQLHHELLGTICLASLLRTLGDPAAAQAYTDAWREAGTYVREAAQAARMASAPGWNPATRSFSGTFCCGRTSGLCIGCPSSASTTTGAPHVQ